jgi:two-component system, sensor histidine kinase LadS
MAWFGHVTEEFKWRRPLADSMASCLHFVSALLVGMAISALAHAVPLVGLGQQANQPHDQGFATIDLRRHWESSLVSVPDQPNSLAFDPNDVWRWADGRFTRTATPGQLVLTGRQRFVARIELASIGSGDGIYLNFKIPRLDAVHVAYRYGDGPWTRESAGDTLPMNTWPFADRQPAFDIPQRPGNLSIVVEIAHRGSVDAPMVLQNSNAFRLEGLNAALKSGLLLGINLVLAAVGILAAVNFRRLGFLAISVMTLLMAGVVSATSGLAGVYAFTDSAIFNDQAKFVTNSLWCVLFPWVTATVLSQRLHARWWWRAAVVWAVAGTFVTVWWMPYPLRDVSNQGVGWMAISSVVLALAVVLNALVRRQAHALATLPGVVLYAGSLAARLAAQTNSLSVEDAIMYASLATLAAALIFLQVLIKQHRQGRMVMARARTSPGRDVLTGLLNRQGFEQMLVKNVNRMFAEKSYAAFFYIKLSDTTVLQDRYGDEGFEVGMVQMAAAISSSMSVVDTVGRVASNAFAVMVMMPRDVKIANAMAQKLVTRTMALATHGAPMAQTARIAIAWLPVFGTLLPDIERRTQRTLEKMENGKRIAWVGGSYAQMDASQMPDGMSSPTTKPNNGPSADDELPSVPGMINRIEYDMLGPDSEHLQAEAERLMQVMKNNLPQDDFANTKTETRGSTAVN